MYIRFVTTKIHHRSEVPGGLFTIAYEIAREGSLPEYDRALLKKCLRWFDEHLDAPAIEAPGRSRRRVIFWFKQSARQHLDVMRDMVSILDRNDIPIRIVAAQRAGYVVYEDDYQVAAQPFWDTVRILKCS